MVPELDTLEALVCNLVRLVSKTKNQGVFSRLKMAVTLMLCNFLKQCNLYQRQKIQKINLLLNYWEHSLTYMLLYNISNEASFFWHYGKDRFLLTTFSFICILLVKLNMLVSQLSAFSKESQKSWFLNEQSKRFLVYVLFLSMKHLL